MFFSDWRYNLPERPDERSLPPERPDPPAQREDDAGTPESGEEPTPRAGGLSLPGDPSRWAQRRRLIRPLSPNGPGVQGVLLGWCLWLLGAWLMLLPSGTSAMPAAKWMIFTAMLGLMTVWPAVRLSQARLVDVMAEPNDTAKSGDLRRWRLLTVLLEWVCLMLVFQAVLWPLRLAAAQEHAGQWTLEQGAWLDGAVAAWSLLTAAIVGWGCLQRGGGRRMAAMVLCMLLLFGEPIVMAIAVQVGGAGSGWSMRLSPFQTLWHLTAPLQKLALAPAAAQVISVAAAAVLAWAALLGWRERGRGAKGSSDVRCGDV